MSILTAFIALLVLMHGHPVTSYNSCVSNCFNLVESLSTCERLCSTPKSSTQRSNTTTPKIMTDSETMSKSFPPNFTSPSSNTTGSPSSSEIPSERPTNSILEIPELSTTSFLESTTLKSNPSFATSASSSPSVGGLSSPSPSSISSKPPLPTATSVADDHYTKPSLLTEESSTLSTSPTTQISNRPASQPSFSNPKGGDSLFEPGSGNESEVLEASDSMPPHPDSPTTSQSQSQILINCTVFYSIEFFSKVLN